MACGVNKIMQLGTALMASVNSLGGGGRNQNFQYGTEMPVSKELLNLPFPPLM